MGIAVLIHEGATILVVINALRLLRVKDVPEVDLRVAQRWQALPKVHGQPHGRIIADEPSTTEIIKE